MADDEEAVVLACTSLVFCALDLHQSQEQLLEKVRWTCPPQSTLWRRFWARVMRVAPVVTSVSRRAVRQARHSTSRLLVPKCMGYIACRVVSVTWRNKWNLGYNPRNKSSCVEDVFRRVLDFLCTTRFHGLNCIRFTACRTCRCRTCRARWNFDLTDVRSRSSETPWVIFLWLVTRQYLSIAPVCFRVAEIAEQ